MTIFDASKQQEICPEGIRLVSTTTFVALTSTHKHAPINQVIFRNMNKNMPHSLPGLLFDMEDAHTKSWNDDLNISIDDLDDLHNLERELNQRDDSFSFDEHHLQTVVADRKTPTTTRRNLLSVSPLKFLGVSPLHMQAVNPPTSYDNNLRRPSSTFHPGPSKTESFPSKPQVEAPSIQFNDDSAFRKITKPIPTEQPRNDFTNSNGFHSPKNSLSNGFHSPKNPPKNGFFSPSNRSSSLSHRTEDDFCSRYLSATPHQDTTQEEEYEEDFGTEEELFEDPSANMLNITDLDTNDDFDSYFNTERVKRKLFDESLLSNGHGERSIQHQLKDILDSIEDDDTFSDIVEITSPLLNLTKSFVSLEESPSPYKSTNFSRDSYYSQNSHRSFPAKDNSFNFDSDFTTSPNYKSVSNAFDHTKPNTTFQSKPASNNTFQSSFPYQNQSNTTFSNISKPKITEEIKPQRSTSREMDIQREKQILQDQQQRLENILKSLNIRK